MVRQNGDEDIAHPPDSLKAVELLARYRSKAFTQSWVPGVLCRVIRDRGIEAMAYLQNPEDLAD